MSMHTCRTGHEGVLADGCDRCAEHAIAPLCLELDRGKMSELWDEMLRVEYDNNGNYVTRNDKAACTQMYRLSVWLERYMGISPTAVKAFLELKPGWERTP